MNAEETLCLVALGYCVNMGLELSVVGSRGRNRKFRQRRLELERFCDLIIDVIRRQFDDGPFTFFLALHTCDSAGGQLSADINAVLALARAAIANDVVVVPNPAEEIGANVLELIPALGNRQFG